MKKNKEARWKKRERYCLPKRDKRSWRHKGAVSASLAGGRGGKKITHYQELKTSPSMQRKNYPTNYRFIRKMGCKSGEGR